MMLMLVPFDKLPPARANRIGLVDKWPLPPHVARSMLIILAFVLLSAFCAALLRGFTGFGFAIAAVPLLSLGLPPARVVPLAVLMQLLASLLDLRAAARITDWRSARQSA
jgi:hypothetical protein